LFTVKRFGDMLGGHVAVQSEIGRGTRFTVTLPRLPRSDHGQ
jgi:signal transduction histidine kinase